MAKKQHLVGDEKAIYQGTDVVIEVTVEGSGDISSWPLSCSIMPQRNATPFLTVTSAGGAIVVTSGLGRTYEITLTDTQTAILRPGLYHWESRRTADGSETVLVEGDCEVRLSAQA